MERLLLVDADALTSLIYYWFLVCPSLVGLKLSIATTSYYALFTSFGAV